MAQGLGQAVSAGVAAGRQHKPISPQRLAIPQGERESTLWHRLRPKQGHPLPHLHASSLRRLAQTGHHREGGLGAGEKAAIRLPHQIQAVLVEPTQRFPRTKTGKRTQQGRPAAGVMA